MAIPSSVAAIVGGANWPAIAGLRSSVFIRSARSRYRSSSSVSARFATAARASSIGSGIVRSPCLVLRCGSMLRLRVKRRGKADAPDHLAPSRVERDLVCRPCRRPASHPSGRGHASDRARGDEIPSIGARLSLGLVIRRFGLDRGKVPGIVDDDGRGYRQRDAHIRQGRIVGVDGDEARRRDVDPRHAVRTGGGPEDRHRTRQVRRRRAALGGCVKETLDLGSVHPPSSFRVATREA